MDVDGKILPVSNFNSFSLSRPVSDNSFSEIEENDLHVTKLPEPPV
jgi:hypothetical protein